MAGYSKKSLRDKLGIRDDFRIGILNAPRGYIGTLRVKSEKQMRGDFDFLQYFTTHRKELMGVFPRLKRALRKDGMLWISWPKQSSGVKTDLNENIVMNIGLAHGLVDVKVAAIDETWSGLKFVWRTQDRK